MKSALPGVLRRIAIVLMAGGILLGGLFAYGAAAAPAPPEANMASRLAVLAQAVAVVLGLVGLAAVLYALAALLDHAAEVPAGQETDEWRETIKDLAQSVGELRASIAQLPASPLAPGRGDAEALDQAASPAPQNPARAQTAPALAHSMRQAIGLLEEIRELTLLNDEQRQQRLADERQQRRQYLLEEVDNQLRLEHWGAADKAAAAFAREFPDDPQADQLRERVADSGQQTEQKSFAELRERVEDLMAISSWDQAYAETMVFLENFPGHTEARQLRSRVIRERDIFMESNANRLYHEVKSDIEKRYWRRALGNATTLLERFPGHRRSATIREQLETIKNNAEIEERQDQERQIQELLRSKRFPEAIELAENLLERFPNSPQAESLQKLLPKMRTLAIEKEIENEM